jgi:FkbM family methyltransferase
MAKYCSTVWAFEPNPKLFAVLCASAVSNISCRAEALSDQDGQTSLLVPGSGNRYSNQGASLSPVKVGDQPHMRVPVTMARLDSLSPPSTGLLKIDVEGHERAMIEGAAELIARDKPTLIVEIEERHTGRPLDEDLDYIESLGYRTFVLLRGRLCGRQVLADGAGTRVKGAKQHGINNFIFLPKD